MLYESIKRGLNPKPSGKPTIIGTDGSDVHLSMCFEAPDLESHKPSKHLRNFILDGRGSVTPLPSSTPVSAGLKISARHHTG